MEKRRRKERRKNDPPKTPFLQVHRAKINTNIIPDKPCPFYILQDIILWLYFIDAVPAANVP
ncbi:MAG: hypothetical protein JRI44_14065 [Deltaproteobacteria bacterium]|nr:hypothetical protein [Deltaproteobacteria bacterium]